MPNCTFNINNLTQVYLFKSDRFFKMLVLHYCMLFESILYSIIVFVIN